MKAASKKEFVLPDWMYLDDQGNKHHKTKCNACDVYFIPKQFNFAAQLCLECSNRAAVKFGVPFENVSHAQTSAHNWPWYKSKLKEGIDVSDYEGIRALLLAVKVSVIKPTPREEFMAADLRAKFPGLTKETPAEIADYLELQMKGMF